MRSSLSVTIREGGRAPENPRLPQEGADYSHDHSQHTEGATMEDGRRTIKASEFKAKCLKLMDEVAATGEEIVITKNGTPVSALVPYRRKPATFFGRDRHGIRVLGDIVEPVDVEWEAEIKPRQDC